jgi:YfiH family protein
LICRPLEDAGFANGFSTRLGGISPLPANDLNLSGFDQDSRENIAENRRRFLAVLGSDFKLATAWQVHGDAIKRLETIDDIDKPDDRADALISKLTGVLAGVKTADCVPILLGDTSTGVFAAVHAGWRGTVLSIVKKAVNAMTTTHKVKPQNIIAAIGPAAGCNNYEVGHDVIDAFADNFERSERYFTPRRDGHALVDLKAANRDQLLESGLKPVNIYVAPLCTIERTDLFFSYRVEKEKFGKTGRLLSVIGRKDALGFDTTKLPRAVI